MSLCCSSHKPHSVLPQDRPFCLECRHGTSQQAPLLKVPSEPPTLPLLPRGSPWPQHHTLFYFSALHLPLQNHLTYLLPYLLSVSLKRL